MNSDADKIQMQITQISDIRKTKIACYLAPPNGKIFNQLSRTMKALMLMNNVVENAIFQNGQAPEISVNQK